MSCHGSILLVCDTGSRVLFDTPTAVPLSWLGSIMASEEQLSEAGTDAAIELEGEDPLQDEEPLCLLASMTAESELDKLCAICNCKPRKLRQMFGPCCEALVRAARRDAKSQGAEALAAFVRLQKLGPKQFVVGLLEYKARCFSHRGFRRPQFAWARYVMIVEIASHMEFGQKHLWLAEAGFVKYQIEMEGLCELEARQKFVVEKQRMPPSKVSKDGKKILWQVEDHLLTYDSKAQREQIQLGAKDVSFF